MFIYAWYVSISHKISLFVKYTLRKIVIHIGHLPNNISDKEYVCSSITMFNCSFQENQKSFAHWSIRDREIEKVLEEIYLVPLCAVPWFSKHLLGLVKRSNDNKMLS